MRLVELKIDSATRSPSKPSTSSAKVARISVSYSYIEPETSRHSTMSREENSGVSIRSLAIRPESTEAAITASTAMPTCSTRTMRAVR